MSLNQAIHFVLLGAVWGASYLFIRLAIHDLGPIVLAQLRLATAALTLIPIFLLMTGWRIHLKIAAPEFRRLSVVALFNSAIPFCLIAFAMQTLSTGVGAILNSTAPLWGALVAYLFLKESLSAARALGLFLGFCGVLILVAERLLEGVEAAIIPVASALLGTLSYGAAANYIKRTCADIPPLKLTFGSMFLGALYLLPLAIYLWPAQALPAKVYWAMLGLGTISTAYAYIMYFKLIDELGPARAIAVTFLIPLFGVVWGEIFLAEAFTPLMLLGGAVIVLGTALTTGLLGGSKKNQA